MLGEARKGRLVISRIMSKEVVSEAAIRDMVKACEVEPPVPFPPRDPNRLSDEEDARLAQEAALATLAKLGEDRKEARRKGNGAKLTSLFFS